LYAKKREELGGAPGYEQFYPIDLEKVLKIMGWTVDRVEMVGHSNSDDPIDAQVDFRKKALTIGVHEGMPRGRINFSIAHEIGHILLHGEKGVGVLLRTRSVPVREKRSTRSHRHPIEIEADRFAAEILMPSKAVKVQFQQRFECSAIVMGSRVAEQISKSPMLDRKSLAFSIAGFQPSRDQSSLADFFGVSRAAMGNRLIELRCVLD
jgi:Zn-dependent peptidase ImmA (M78 family)